MPHITRRNTQLRLPHSTKRKLASVLDEQIQPETHPELGPSTFEKRGRCSKCVSSLQKIQRSVSYNKICKTKQICQLCSSQLCAEHAVQMCFDCYNKREDVSSDNGE